MNQREKAARKVAARVALWPRDAAVIPKAANDLIDLQVAVDEAAELIDRLLGEVVGPFADKTIVDESADWLSRNERKEI